MECDFIVKNGFDVSEAIQVATSLADDKTRKRELRGLLACCAALGLKEGLIITLEGREEFTENGVTVRVMPLYRWLLG